MKNHKTVSVSVSVTVTVTVTITVTDNLFKHELQKRPRPSHYYADPVLELRLHEVKT